MYPLDASSEAVSCQRSEWIDPKLLRSGPTTHLLASLFDLIPISSSCAALSKLFQSLLGGFHIKAETV